MSSVDYDEEKQLSRCPSNSTGDRKISVDEPAGPVALAFAESANRGARDAGECSSPHTTTFRTVLGAVTGSGNKEPSESFPRTATRNSHRVAVFRTLSIQIGETGPDHRTKLAGKKSKLQQSKRALLPWSKKREEAHSTDEVDYFATLDYHLVDGKQICERFNTHPEQGLDAGAAQRRLATDGPNVLTRKRPNQLLKLIGYATKGFCSILWVGVILFFICWRPLGDPNPQAYNLALAVLILLVIFLQAIFNGLQDYSTNKVMDSIKGLMPSETTVIRDGEKQTVAVSSLVAGDIVVLAQGTKVPADIRLLTASDDLAFDRAVLTGESEEVAGITQDDESNFLESKDIAFLGSFVASGAGTGVVVLTGGKSVMGRINKLTNTGVERKTNLQKEIDRFVWIIIGLTVSFVLIMLIVWLAFLRPQHPGFLNTVGILVNMMSLVVSALPSSASFHQQGLTLTLYCRSRSFRRECRWPSL